MTRDDFGIWEIKIAHSKDGSVSVPHDSKVKISMITQTGERIERLPAYTTRAVQDMSKNPVYEAVFWNPSEQYIFKYKVPEIPTDLRIYESHGK